MSNEGGVIHGASGGGVAGQHPAVAPLQFFAAPSMAGEFNSAHLRLIPVACWRVDEIRFAFDSSFVTPDIATELEILVTLREAHKNTDANGKALYPPLSVFGHADPVGSDDYNKALSGRRATAIYALLLAGAEAAKSVALWQQIAATEKWDTNQRQVMQTKTGLPASTPDSALFKAYMQKLCPANLQLTPQDFLGQGADDKGKGDYQGCSEFNPLLIFSENAQTAFKQASDHTARNLANAPNRRVLVLLFRPGSQILPSRWPCPRATDGKAGCLKRFWSDGELRRSKRLPQADRKFEETQDTFACRFFQRLSSGSPCQAQMQYFQVRLYDPTGKYIAFAPYRLSIGGAAQPPQKADEKGLIVGQNVEVPSRCLIEWAFPPVGEEAQKEPPVYRFKAEVFLSLDSDDRKRTIQMLNNLGYPGESAFEENVADFQTDYQRDLNLQVSGQADPRTKKAIHEVHTQCDDDLRATKESSGGQA